MKKRLSVILTVILALALITTALSACTGKTIASKGGVKSKEVYAFSAMTSVEYLSNMPGAASVNTNGNMFAKLSPRLVLNAETAPVQELARPASFTQDVNELARYIKMFEGYMTPSGIQQTTGAPTAEDGEYATYQIKQTVTTTNALGETVTYVMYYNETAQAADANPEEVPEKDPANADANTEENESDKPADEEEETEEQEDEVSTTLTGVLIYNNQVFTISGEKEVTIEGEEKEVEIEFTTRSEANPDNYIVVKQEVELEEVEFAYSIYEKGELVNETNVSWENEQGEKAIELEFTAVVEGKETLNMYEIELTKENTYSVSYDFNGSTGSLTIVRTAEQLTVTYDNGFVETIQVAK
ncbi:MAG: hypothetical protein RR418_04445 [Clostridia bacterium]